MEFRINGLDGALRKLESLRRNAEALEGGHQVPMVELFNANFMRRHTHVTSFEALVEAGGWRVESQADFEAIPDVEWEAVVQKHTSFTTWQEMKEKAAQEYLTKKVFSSI